MKTHYSLTEFWEDVVRSCRGTFKLVAGAHEIIVRFPTHDKVEPDKYRIFIKKESGKQVFDYYPESWMSCRAYLKGQMQRLFPWFDPDQKVVPFITCEPETFIAACENTDSTERIITYNHTKYSVMYEVTEEFITVRVFDWEKKLVKEEPYKDKYHALIRLRSVLENYTNWAQPEEIEEMSLTNCVEKKADVTKVEAALVELHGLKKPKNPHKVKRDHIELYLHFDTNDGNYTLFIHNTKLETSCRAQNDELNTLLRRVHMASCDALREMLFPDRSAE